MFYFRLSLVMRIITLVSLLVGASSSGFDKQWDGFLASNWDGSLFPAAGLDLVVNNWIKSVRFGNLLTTEAPTTKSREGLGHAGLKEGPYELVVSEWAPMEEAVLARMSPGMRLITKQQMEKDEREKDWCPLIYYKDEFPIISGVRQRLVLGHRIGAYQFSTLFLAASESHQYVVKYQSDCETPQEVHPLLREFWFLQGLNHTDIATKVYYISPAVRWTGPITAKTAFTMADSKRRACLNVASVRYLVMATGFSSLAHMMRKPNRPAVTFASAIYVMETLVGKIERMHALGVIHGDIHPGNVMLTRMFSWEASLMNFGSAMFAHEQVKRPMFMHQPWSHVNRFLTHWNVQGFRFSFRDDVLRALEIGAFLMNGEKYTEYMERLEQRPQDLFEFKKSALIFTWPGGQDVLGGLGASNSQRSMIFGHLARALEIARSVDQLDGIPNYAGILTELRHVAHIVHHL